MATRRSLISLVLGVCLAVPAVASADPDIVFTRLNHTNRQRLADWLQGDLDNMAMTITRKERGSAPLIITEFERDPEVTGFDVTPQMRAEYRAQERRSWRLTIDRYGIDPRSTTDIVVSGPPLHGGSLNHNGAYYGDFLRVLQDEFPNATIHLVPMRYVGGDAGWDADYQRIATVAQRGSWAADRFHTLNPDRSTFDVGLAWQALIVASPTSVTFSCALDPTSLQPWFDPSRTQQRVGMMSKEQLAQAIGHHLVNTLWRAVRADGVFKDLRTKEAEAALTDLALLLDRYRPFEGPGEEDPFFHQERATVHRLLKFDDIVAQWTRANDTELDTARREGVEFGIRIPTGGALEELSRADLLLAVQDIDRVRSAMFEKYGSGIQSASHEKNGAYRQVSTVSDWSLFSLHSLPNSVTGSYDGLAFDWSDVDG